MIRQPIVILVGHIDHGKSSILEKIRGISITKAEAGGITQSIKSYNVAIEIIKKITGPLLKALHLNVTIPGILFLDSPGHAAFNNMRKRGGNLADIAILVIDIAQGIQEQTRECINILKQYKTPFIIALNKVDLLQGWRSQLSPSLIQSIKQQSDYVQQELDKKLYNIVSKLGELGFNAERFDRVDDYTKQIALIPLSAKTAEGLPELLMVITGLSQKFLEKSLQSEVKGPGKGTVLEVTEEKGLGITLDVILYDGSIKVNDQIIIGTLGEPLLTKVRGIYEPEGKKFKRITQANAARGIKLVAPNTEQVFGGMPLLVANEAVQQAIKTIKEEVQEVVIETDHEGIIVKADTLGSLEALVNLLKLQKIKIKKASIGDISKKDSAEALAENDEMKRVILGFNVKNTESSQAKIITNNVIYRLIEDYQTWLQEEKKKLETKSLASLTKPCKIKILKGFIFRQSNPAVVGVLVVNGILKNDTEIMKADGSKIGHIKSLQLEGETLSEAERGKEVAVSIPNVIVGRQIKENDILYSNLSEEEFKKLKESKDFLQEDEIEVLKEIAVIKRKLNPTWGI